MADEENYDEEYDDQEVVDDEPVDDAVEDGGDEDDGGADEKADAPELREWMVRKNCWSSEFFDVLVEYGYDDPKKIKTIDEEMFDAMKQEILEEFTNVDRRALARFEKFWRNRISGPRSPNGVTSPRARGGGRGAARGGRGRGRGRGRGKRRSPQPSPRRGQTGAGFSGGSGDGLELRRWMKQKGCLHLDLWEFLVSRGITSAEQIIEKRSVEVKRLTQEALAYYIKSGRSGMEKTRFEANSTKFIKVHRDEHGVDHILDSDALNAKATIWDSSQDQTTAQAPELKRLMQQNEFNVIALLEELVSRGITTQDQLLETPEGDIDDIINRVKASQARELQTKLLRDRLEGKLNKFRVYWVANNFA